MTLFDARGHLSEQTLQALHTGTLEENERLAAGQHLCCCETCMNRYVQSLTEETLLAPPRPLASQVARALQKQGAHKRISMLYGAACGIAALWLLLGLAFATPPAQQPVQGMPAPTGQFLPL